ncbi:MAG: class IV adenylate cyclase [Candidatus Paceibacterota bacterium]
MKEIEILVKIEDTKSNVLKTLSEYERVGIKETLDIYFYDPLRKDLQPEKDFRLKRSFRLRKKDGNFFLTYKIDNFDKDNKWIYSNEHETGVDKFEELMKTIKHLGFKELVRIENKKHTFKTTNYEIVFEDVKNLGYFLEVEKMSEVSDDKVAEVKQEIREFIKSLNIKVGNELNAGKPELMLRVLKNGIF